ncbi:lipopolysaccharide biosynthesis protein [Pseudochrobactrum sp. sp1633]|uniref:lipopolysaccharide biosynthesis protein n=1 Tax=Pseudochrobactrum sp. sp1633 TaxID=3036706 RepID=UPI0025A6099F|nr:lipopolysaccharide biosynthesis protein [Pseudochrobactrum sp. sp1633]MDM8346471.1 lipopolysaccharide biosynthesis protein [Pseudochrobactrum sp. sp1633]HWD12687.1 lipopolysaccharide biosynthesis protein [Pseudochrobactrum sp.]
MSETELPDNRLSARIRRHVPSLLSYMASSGSLIMASVAQLVTFAILARFLGAAEFGMFITIMAITSIAVHVCGIGGAESLLRRVAQNNKIYPVLLGHNLILVSISGAFLIAAGMIILPYWIQFSEDPVTNQLSLFLYLVTNIVLLRLILLVEAVYIGHSNFKAANLSVVGFAFARTFAAVVACMAFGVSTINGWAWWQFACHLLVAAFYWFLLIRLGKPTFRIVREELKLGVFFATPFIFRAIRQNIDLLLLGLLLSPAVIGSYGVARRIVDSSYLNIDAMSRLLYPRFAKMSANGIDKAWPLAQKAALMALGIAIFTATFIYFLAPYLPLVFGQEYQSMVYFTQVLCWVIIFYALWSVGVEAMGAAGEHGYRAAILNTGNLIGAPVLAFATWLMPPTGTFISIYLIEFSIALSAWLVLSRLVRKAAQRSA